MAKVQTIQKSRKEYKCSRCGKVIPVGSKYFKGEINFGPTIIRCADCGLQPYEVTTSDWTLNVGRLLDKWSEDYPVCDGVVDDIIGAVEEIRDEQQERLDNMPEHLQYAAGSGETLTERIDACDSAISDLESIDCDDMKSTALEQFLNEHENEEEFIVLFEGSETPLEDMDYDEVLNRLRELNKDELADELEGQFNSDLEEAIGEALTNNLETC